MPCSPRYCKCNKPVQQDSHTNAASHSLSASIREYIARKCRCNRPLWISPCWRISSIQQQGWRVWINTWAQRVLVSEKSSISLMVYWRKARRFLLAGKSKPVVVHELLCQKETALNSSVTSVRSCKRPSMPSERSPGTKQQRTSKMYQVWRRRTFPFLLSVFVNITKTIHPVNHGME